MIIHKSGRKHSDIESPSRAPVDPRPETTEEGDAFLSAISECPFAQQERADLDLNNLIDYRESKTTTDSRVFKRGESAFYLRYDMLEKKNFTTNKAEYLFVVSSTLRDKIRQASHNEATLEHQGLTRTLGTIHERYCRSGHGTNITQYVRTCQEC